MPTNDSWLAIDTVLWDMGETLLDLAFAHHFWLYWIPQKLSEYHGITLDETNTFLQNKYCTVQRILNRHGFTYWRGHELDIHHITLEIGARVRRRPNTSCFLDALRPTSWRTISITHAAHPLGLAVKPIQTRHDHTLDLRLASHALGYPKADQGLWQAFQQHAVFNSTSTLFINNTASILDATQCDGIRYCLSICYPDTSLMTEQQFSPLLSIEDFHTLMPVFYSQ